MRKQFTTAILILAALYAPVQAEKFAVLGNKVKKTFEFKADDTLNVTGNHNDLLVTGSGDSVQIMGNHNTITVDALVKRVRVVGNHNDIIVIKKEGRKAPLVEDIGNKNRVKE